MDDRGLERYSRQLLVPGFELDGQESLAGSSVVVVGCGGLGSLAAQYLAGAGVGRLVLVDPDRIELSNLPRQVAYIEDDIGQFKSDVLAVRLRRMNADLQVESRPIAFDPASGPALVGEADAVLDGTDNHRARLVIDRITATYQIPWFMGAAVQMAGQAIAFSGLRSEGCYHCLAPEADMREGGCATLGILGPVVGMVALQQVLDLLGALSGVATVRWGLLRHYDFRNNETVALAVEKRTDCSVCGSSDRSAGH